MDNCLPAQEGRALCFDRRRHPLRALLFAAASLGPLAVLSSAAQAQQDLPAQVRTAIQESRKSCDGQKLTLGRGFITRRDINGDGVNDFILNYEHAGCGDMSSFFCGTGGCTFQVFASFDGDYVKVMDQNAHSVRFEPVARRPAMIQFLHGVHCGRSGAEGGCRSVTYWNGAQFSPAVPFR
jgi:hypothetical protein